MEKENASFEFKFKKWNKMLFLEKIKHNELISKKYKKTCKALNYF